MWQTKYAKLQETLADAEKQSKLAKIKAEYMQSLMVALESMPTSCWLGWVWAIPNERRRRALHHARWTYSARYC
jgi:hypothetical protein